MTKSSGKQSEANDSPKGEQSIRSTNSAVEREQQKDVLQESRQDSGAEEEEEDNDDPLYSQLAAKYNLDVEDEEEEEDDTSEGHDIDSFSPEPIPQLGVDLSKFTQRYDAKKSSTLRPLLVEYGMEDPTRERRRREREKRNQRKRRESEGDEAVKDKAVQEYYVGVYDSLNRLRDAYYAVYLSKLQNRVEEQRKQIKKKSAELERKIAEQNQRPKFQKKMELHKVVHDDDYLKKIARSETYKLVKYEEKLRQKGKLRYQYELEEFWRLAREEPEKLHEMLKREKIEIIKDPVPDHISSYHGSHLSSSFSTTRSSSFASLVHDIERPLMEYRPMTGIEETRETSRPSTRAGPQSWAITQLGTASFSSESSKGSRMSFSRRSTQNSMGAKKSLDAKSMDPHTKAKLAAQELEKKFPQKELPPLSCFTLDLGDQGPDAEQILQQVRQQRRHKERTLFVKRIRKMYHLAQANSASTRRIMQKHGDDFELAIEGPDMETMLSSYDLYKEPQPPLSQGEERLSEQPWLRHIRHRAIVTIEEESEPSVAGPSAAVKARSAPSRSRGSIKSTAKTPEPPRPPALNLESLTESSKTVEAKCMSTFWSNYLGVGKSVFAK